MSTALRARGGRPPASDRRTVALIALRMFAARGFETVTMADIAREAGIGKTTLQRYFPSKLAIAWDRADEDAERLARLIDSIPPEADPLDALCDAIPRMIVYPDDELDVLRTQVLVLAQATATSDAVMPRFTAGVELVERFLTRRLGTSRGPLYIPLVTTALLSAGWYALLTWAKSDDPRPDPHLIDGYAIIRAGLR